MAESWRPVLGNPTYEVSDEGRVRRAIASKKYPLRYPVGGILHPSSDTDGYPIVSLVERGGVQRTQTVHKLVWEAFRGPVPEGLEVNHKGTDGDKTNSRLSNLECVTHSQNIVHAYRVLGKINPRAKLTPARVVDLREKRATGFSRKALAKEFDLHPIIVSRIASGDLWPCVGGPRTAPERLGRTRSEVAAAVSDEKVREVVARRKAGESATALAKELGVSRRAIWQWTRGTHRAS